LAVRFSFSKIFCLTTAFFLISCSGTGKVSLQNSPKLSPPEEAHLKSVQAQLASSKAFYVELSVRDKELRLCHSGVFLRKYKINDIKLEEKRFFFFHDGGSLRWSSKLLAEGEFSPPRVLERVKIIPGDETTRPTPDKPGIIPPTMEELILVPSSYDLLFPNGFALKIHLEGETPGKASKLKRTSLLWNDFLIGLGVRKGPSVRLRIEMDAKEGAAFFRTCPQKAVLLVLP
jgi:hypothetical protein